MKTSRILCVDDDEDDLILIREAIERNNEHYEVLEAFDGVQALELLEQMGAQGVLPCLIILDINMPRMNGKQTLTHIKKDVTLQSIPLIVFTTSSNTMDKMFCELHGVEMITKPYDLKSTQMVVKKMLQACA
ncbi:MAG TPA: response regulator [Chitinophagaceae bacterium]|jgi:CheY-like chemotaxis protein|nr:response regulator [Chitinophagaceae bacterium]